ncbi:SUMO-interacting motif-containing protein 1 isoform X2 [Anoplopoma fimbria]|nr:SUMO-interacting motif-containing protein 1 isoform X2 [Anoplopoma fimbria]
MDEVITLSSDSDPEDSDVEIIGSFSNAMSKSDPLPLTAVRVEVDAVNVPTLYIDLTDPRWTLPELKLKIQKPSALTVVDLTESNVANGTTWETNSLPPDDTRTKKESKSINQTSHRQECNLQKSSSRDRAVFALPKDCSHLKPKKRPLDSQTQDPKQADKTHHGTPIVKLRRLPFHEAHIADLKTSKCSVYLNKDCTQMSLHLPKADNNSGAPECISNLRRTTASNGTHLDPSLDESPPQVVESVIRQEEQENNNTFTSTQLNGKISPHRPTPADSACSDKGGSVATSKEPSTRDDKRDDLCSSELIPFPKSTSLSQDEAERSLQREEFCSELEKLQLDKAESRQSYLSDPLFPNSPATGPNPSEHFDLDSLSHTNPISHNLTSQVDPTPTSEHELAQSPSEKVKADEASNCSDFLHWSVPNEPLLSVSNEDMDDSSGAGTYRGDLGIDSPVSFLWQEGSDGDEVNKDSRFDLDFRVASREDRQFVCPVTLRKIMSGPVQSLLDEEENGFGAPEVLCRQSLSLVYSTIDESYTEGTLQLLSDLLQPGYYPPRDITSHLLRGVLLDPQCPYHLCVQAFNLLMRTQRHHMADKTTIPWDWELLTTVMADQRHPCEVVRMLLDYIVQTLEDDFQAKHSISALHHSITKATLSCDQQFPRVREVMKWLFSAIMKSTEHGETREAARERDALIRMVSIFQRMLSLALEVDRSPALSSGKLSQELFHMLISNIPLRAHRMLLLESLQSKLLR